MLERSSKTKSSRDINVIATRIVEQTSGESQPEVEESINGKNPNAVALGRLGGLKGGKARANKLTPERKKEIARKAAYIRWSK